MRYRADQRPPMVLRLAGQDFTFTEDGDDDHVCDLSIAEVQLGAHIHARMDGTFRASCVIDIAEITGAAEGPDPESAMIDALGDLTANLVAFRDEIQSEIDALMGALA